MANENVKVSFVIPVYNVEQFLNQCIDSIVNQTDPAWELILVDNGSTDSGGKICDEYAKNDSRIQVVHQENKGPASARNIGLKKAVGQWISYIDSDDWIETDYIEKLSPYMSEDRDVIFFAYDIITEQGKKIVLDKNAVVSEVTEQDMKLLEKQSIDTGAGNEHTIVGKYRGQVWTKLYRKQFLLENHLCSRENLMRSQDVMFNLEVFGKAKTGVFVPVVLYHYRKLQNSLCHSFHERQTEHLTAFVEEMGRYLSATGKMGVYEQEYKLRVVLAVANCCFLNYCHPENKKGFALRRREFKELCAREPYAEAIHTLQFPKKMSFPKKVIAWAVKQENFALLSLLSIAEKKVKRA